MDSKQELLKRIKKSPDGQDFIDYLTELSLDNYKAFKNNPSSLNDIHKGYALAIDSLLEAFERCTLDKEENTFDFQSTHY
jgi:hypothetical protein